MRRSILLVLLAFSFLAGCPKGGSTPSNTGDMPAAVQTFPALRWVPADASYVVVTRTGADMSNLMRELANVLGIMGDFSGDDAGGASRFEFGFDVLSLSSLQGVGIDTEASGVMFSAGFSPTIVVRLADPTKFEAFLDDWRQRGMSVQSQLEDGVEVFTVNLGRDTRMSWSVIDGWLIAHMSLEVEREEDMAWLKAARGAGGAFAGHADFTATLDAARAHAGSLAGADGLPPVVATIRAPQVMSTAMRMHGDDEMGRCLQALGGVQRIFASGGVGERVAGGAIVVELADATPVAGAVLPAPGGWYQARAGAPLQLDVGFDLVAASALLSRCGLPVRGLADEVGARSGHVFIRAFDGDFPAIAGAYADLSHDRTVRGLLNQIPMLGQFSSKRKVGAVEVIDVDVPFVGEFAYHLTSGRLIGTMGSGVIEAILGAGDVPVSELFHFELHPRAIPAEAMNLMLEQAGMANPDRRERTITRLDRWETGLIDVGVEGSTIVVTATGTLRK